MKIKFPARDKHLETCAEFEKSLDDTIEHLQKAKAGFVQFKNYEDMSQFRELEMRLIKFKSDYEAVAKNTIYSHLKDSK